MAPRIIAVAGIAGSGKDTVGAFLNGIGFTRHAFADGVREALLTLNPYVGTSPTGMIRLRQVVSEYGWTQAKKNPEVRRVMQTFATEVCREMFDRNVWIDQLHKKIKDSKKVVITDLRFINEARWVHDEMGGEVWMVVRPITEIDMPMTDEAKAHPSETEIVGIHADIQIVNDGTLEDLKRQVLRFGNRPASENRCGHDHP